VLFGLVAVGLVEASSLALVFLVALMLVVAGGAEILLGFNTRDWPSFFLWLISGLFYLVFGAFALARPEVAAAVLTAGVGAGFLVPGLARIWLGFKLPGGANFFSAAGGRGRHPARRPYSGGMARQFDDHSGNSVPRRSGVLRIELDRARPPAAAMTPVSTPAAAIAPDVLTLNN
jgi:hypothetical protein